MAGRVGRRAVRLLGRYVRTHPGPLAVAVVAASLYAVGVVGGTVAIGRLTDRVVVPAMRDGDIGRATVVGAGAVVLAIALARSVGIMGRRYFGNMASKRFQVTLRERLADHYLGVDLAFHRSRPTGDLLTTLDNDVERASDALGPVPLSLSVVVLAVVAVTSLWLIDPLMAAVALALIPTVLAVNHRFGRRSEAPARAGQRELGRLGALAHETFDGALVVKALGRERAEVARFAAQAARLRDARLEAGRLRAAFEPLFDLLPAMASVAVVAAGTWRVSTGAMTTGQLVQAVTLFSVLSFPLRVVGYFLEDAPMAVVALDRVDAALADGTRLAAPATPRRLPPDGPLGVEVTGVGHRLGGVEVLDGVSFTIAPGEVVALVGATGSGKSTLCELLVRLADPDEGCIAIGGVPLRTVDPADLHRRVALVLQEAFLFADPITANVLPSTDGEQRLHGVAPAAGGAGRPPGDGDGDPGVAELEEALVRARADGFVARLPDGAHTSLGERGVTLSGGQRQRLALARALALQPGLLILDDATSAVDPVVEAEILAGLRSSSAPATLLIVAHRLSTIRLADRVLFIERGRVVASGAHEDLLARPAYAALARAYERADRAAGAAPDPGVAPVEVTG